jgi:DNA-binding CsgD family transcriptional regulator
MTPAPFLLPTREQREKMVADVERMVLRAVSALPVGVRQDAAQQVRLELWRVSESFDLNGEAKWPTFAMAVSRQMAIRVRHEYLNDQQMGGTGKITETDLRLPIDSLYTSRGCAPESPDDESEDPSQDPDSHFGLLDRALRMQFFAGVLDELDRRGDQKPGSHRRIAEMIGVERLSASQVAEQLGWHVKMVILALRRILEKLAAAGKIPDQLARSAGFDPEGLKGGAGCANKRRLASARRAKIAESIARGVEKAAIAKELGVTPNTIEADLRIMKNRERQRNHLPVSVSIESRRERVRNMVTLGFTSRQIATELGVSIATVNKDRLALNQGGAVRVRRR